MTKNTIGIIGAMEPEIELLKRAMVIEREEKLIHTTAFIGTLNQQDVVLVQSGIGKVNASIIAALMCDKYELDYLINTGVAGALSKKLSVTDMVISNQVAHHDVDASAFGYALGQVPGMPVAYESDSHLKDLALNILSLNSEIKGLEGLVVSGDSFIDNNEVKNDILTYFPDAFCVDMESSAIAQTAYQFNVPFLILRSLSDSADDSADMNYEEFLSKACVHSSEVVKSLLREL